MSDEQQQPRRSAALRRKQPIHLLPFESWDRSPIIFVTACTAHRKPILASPHMYELIVSAWRAANEWLVGRYVIMPDHVHFFCSPASPESRALAKWMQYWKALVTKNWSGAKPVWQPSHWDRQLRREDSYNSKWEYVRWNPVGHKLVGNPDEWPYQGELNALPW